MSESICHDCRHFNPISTGVSECRRYSGMRTDRVRECDGFEPDGAVSRVSKTEQVGKTCDDCTLRHGGLCTFNLSRVEPSMPACRHHSLRIECEKESPDIEQSPIPGPSVRDLIVAECNALCMMLVKKNDKYGNSALEPIRCFSRADPIEQIRVRLDDKISRLMRGTGVEDEDVELDLMGYLVLLRVARRMRDTITDTV